MERSQEERDRFLEELKRCIEACKDKAGVLAIRTMNDRVGDNEVESV